MHGHLGPHTGGFTSTRCFNLSELLFQHTQSFFCFSLSSSLVSSQTKLPHAPPPRQTVSSNKSRHGQSLGNTTFIHTYPEEKVEDKHQVLYALHSPHGSEKLSYSFISGKKKSQTRKSSRVRLSCLCAAVGSEQGGKRRTFFLSFL